MRTLNDLQKVRRLEKTVSEGSLEELRSVLDTYQPFEFMCNALRVASQKRGLAFVQELVNHGATFHYSHNDSALNRRYGMYWKNSTSGGTYYARYYLMSGSPLPLEEKLAVVKFFAEHPQLGASLDDILFDALEYRELDFADALMDMGINLQDTPPSYYEGESYGAPYTWIITSGYPSIYWTSYMDLITRCTPEQIMPVLERFHKLAAASGGKLFLNQRLFDFLSQYDDAWAFLVEHTNISKIPPKKQLAAAISRDDAATVAKLVESGLITRPAQIKELIQSAMDQNRAEALAWLLDYQNRTVDVAAEHAKAEAKALRELMEDPNSVSALKKIWGYQKLQDGTLEITRYKGQDTSARVPAKIGKSMVSAIGQEAFSPYQSRISNGDVRKQLTVVILPETITNIHQEAFWGCENLSRLSVPEDSAAAEAVANARPRCWYCDEIPVHLTPKKR